MALRFRCSACSQLYRVPDSMGGRTIHCFSCGQAVIAATKNRVSDDGPVDRAAGEIVITEPSFSAKKADRQEPTQSLSPAARSGASSATPAKQNTLPPASRPKYLVPVTRKSGEATPATHATSAAVRNAPIPARPVTPAAPPADAGSLEALEQLDPLTGESMAAACEQSDANAASNAPTPAIAGYATAALHAAQTGSWAIVRIMLRIAAGFGRMVGFWIQYDLRIITFGVFAIALGILLLMPAPVAAVGAPLLLCGICAVVIGAIIYFIGAIIVSPEVGLYTIGAILLLAVTGGEWTVRPTGVSESVRNKAAERKRKKGGKDAVSSILGFGRQVLFAGVLAAVLGVVWMTREHHSERDTPPGRAGQSTVATNRPSSDGGTAVMAPPGNPASVAQPQSAGSAFTAPVLLDATTVELVRQLSKLGAGIQMNTNNAITCIDLRFTTNVLANAKVLAGFKRAPTLQLNPSQFTPDVVLALESIPSITRLDFSPVRLRDTDLAHFATLRNVDALNLVGQPITSAGIRTISTMANLKTLVLRHTQIDDASWQYLAKCSALRHLDLTDTRVIGEGMDQLKELKNLQELVLHDTKVTDAAKQALKVSNPELQISPP